MIKLFLEIPQYKLFRSFGFPRKMPFSLTINVTDECNSRCKTCGVYDKSSDELALEELRKIFIAFDSKIHWLTFSGGEPFLRDDFDKICIDAYNLLEPKIINIPTNGMLSDIIPVRLDSILKHCPKSNIIINLSIDGIDSKHDEIRGIRGSYQNVIKSYNRLKKIRNSNFTLGIHTTLSSYNVNDFSEILKQVEELRPDSYIVEYAQKRDELNNLDKEFLPDSKDYAKCLGQLEVMQNKIKYKGVAKIIQALRRQYYGLTKETLLKNKAIIPCFAGFSCAHISSSGQVWACGIKAQALGNLRKENYDFKKIWLSNKAKDIRSQIKKNKCFCINANIYYQNIFFSPAQLFKSCFVFLKNPLI